MLALTLASAAGVFEAKAHAQDYAAAGQHFDAAQEAFAAGKFELAAKEYQAAFDITKESTLLQSIGESWQRAGNAPKALTAYKAYIKAAPQAPDRAAIEERIKAIESAQADASQAPAQASQAPAQASQAPAQASQVPAQASQVPAQASQVPAQASQAPAQASQAPTGPTITPPEPPPSKLRVAGWISVASAVALVTGGAVIGLGAQSRADELRRRTTLVVGDQPLTYSDSERDAYTSLMSEGKTYNTAAISLFAVGGVAAATAITLFVVDFVRKPKPDAQKQALVVPLLGPGTVGLSLVGGM